VVTISGAAGAGKATLAVEAARVLVLVVGLIFARRR